MKLKILDLDFVSSKVSRKYKEKKLAYIYIYIYKILLAKSNIFRNFKNVITYFSLILFIKNIIITIEYSKNIFFLTYLSPYLYHNYYPLKHVYKN